MRLKFSRKLIQGKEARHAAIVSDHFDPVFYVQTNPDVGAYPYGPLTHYIRYGWRERRDPSPSFSIEGYLERYPDVKETGNDPFVHYLLYGRSEGRIAPRSRPKSDRPTMQALQLKNYLLEAANRRMAEQCDQLIRQLHETQNN